MQQVELRVVTALTMFVCGLQLMAILKPIRIVYVILAATLILLNTLTIHLVQYWCLEFPLVGQG